MRLCLYFIRAKSVSYCPPALPNRRPTGFQSLRTLRSKELLGWGLRPLAPWKEPLNMIFLFLVADIGVWVLTILSLPLICLIVLLPVFFFVENLFCKTSTLSYRYLFCKELSFLCVCGVEFRVFFFPYLGHILTLYSLYPCTTTLLRRQKIYFTKIWLS